MIGVLRNESTFALLAYQYACGLELAYRGTHRGNADAMATRKIALNWQAGAGAPFAGCQRLNQLFLDFLVQGQRRHINIDPAIRKGFRL